MTKHRDMFAMALLIVPCLWSNVHESWKQTRDYINADRPYILVTTGKDVAKFKRLGATKSSVGYLSDAAQDSGMYVMESMILQYFFVPSIVVRSDAPDYVVGHIHGTDTAAAFAKQKHLAIVDAEPDGYVLFKKF